MTPTDDMKTQAFEPDYAVPPGATLVETMASLGMTQTELALRTGLSRKTINGIINGREVISADTAIQFERVFRVPARFWLALQRDHDETTARLRERRRMAEHARWVRGRRFPLREMERRSLIPAATDRIRQTEAVFEYFGVCGPTQYELVWDHLQRHETNGGGQHRSIVDAVLATWLRQGELQAEATIAADFDATMLTSRHDAVRDMQQRKHRITAAAIATMLAECGVVFVVIPPIRGLRVRCAARILSPTKALIQLAEWNPALPSCWQRLLHCTEHLLQPGRRRILLGT
jgi:HTH-type transcriptional regulator / antitoxin HigA